MRNISLIIIHCSAVKPNQHSSVKDIDNWHRQRGWKSCGYHFVVRRDGTVEVGRRLDEIGAHCVNHNAHSIGICYEGGLNAAGQADDTRTPAQAKALREIVKRMHDCFPKAVIVGHRDLDHKKLCPCFNAVKEYAEFQPK